MLERIFLEQGDITKIKVDAIVNAANSSLIGGGGVDGAIHRAGGPDILAACRKIVASQGHCPTGEAVITTAGKLSAKYVIHTVGPIWHNGHRNEPALLSSCYRNSMQLAIDHQLQSLAFPNISTGIYGYPKKHAARVAIETVFDFLQPGHSIDRVYFVCFDEENFSIYHDILENLTNTG